MIKGPGVNVWHMGLAKDFLLNARGARLTWAVLASNLFNHPNWGDPSTDITDPTVRVIGSVGGVQGDSVGDKPGARSFRMGLRLRF